ncbi:MAG: hypothetical protein QXS00_06230 [Pyrobaculum sp.]|uniref:hypothetical protein n=1 Tax=Pyrobaculum sp. TaxID=2004705 RepID=UPI0031808DED
MPELEGLLELQAGFKLQAYAVIGLLALIPLAVVLGLASLALAVIVIVVVAIVVVLANLFALIPIWRGYSEVFGKGSLPAVGAELGLIAAAVGLLSLLVSALWPPAGDLINLAAGILGFVSYVLAYIIGARQLYLKYEVDCFHTAFILFVLFFLVIPPIIGIWLMYKGSRDAIRKIEQSGAASPSI